MRKSIISTLALASLACVALAYSAGPTAAKSTCFSKLVACDDRCTAKYGPDEGKGCRQRTCNHQYKNCIAASDGAGAGPTGTTGGKSGPIVRDKRTPRKN